MTNKPQIPDPELIDRIAMMIGSMRDVPEGFVEYFRVCAEKFEPGQSYKSPDTYREWEIEIRPYNIKELLSIPGVPKRTTVYEIRKSLPIPMEKQKNEVGKLTPEVVAMIFEKLRKSKPEESITEKLAKVLKR